MLDPLAMDKKNAKRPDELANKLSGLYNPALRMVAQKQFNVFNSTEARVGTELGKSAYSKKQ